MVIFHIFSSLEVTLFFLHIFAITGSLFMRFSVGILLETFLKLADHSTIASFISLCFFLELVLKCVPDDLRIVLCDILSLNFLLHFLKFFIKHNIFGCAKKL